LDWFGLRFAKSNWTFHLQFGWIYIFEPSNKEEVWFYRPKQMGEFPSSWHWTSRENFPFVFNNSMGWLEFSGEEFYYLEKEFRSGLDSPRMDPQELVYNPFYFYDPGTTVMISLENGQLYTAKTEVPDSDDSRDEFYSPTGPNAGDYWNNFEQTINLFKDENPDFLNLFPTEINTEQRTIELAKIMGWQDEPEDEEDDFGGIFRELIYEPSKHYPAGVAVIEDLKDGEIYTSKIEVPAGKNSDDDTYSPNGPNSRKYWSSSYETVLSFENHNQNFLDQLPKSFVTDSISSEISELVAVRKNYLNIDSLFDGLIYDPHKTYHTGDSVVVSIEGGEIFTAKQKVPSEPNGRHSPNSLNGAKYWYSNSETVAAFEDEFDDFLEALPDSIHWEDLHHEVAKLTIPNDNTDSDKDGISDYLEMIEYKTNPDTDDSDEDGLPDSKEIEWGSDPTQSDQDMVDYLKELGKEEVFKDLQYHGLVSQEEYNEIQEQIELSNDANASPYTNDWFYLPERGWMWTDKSVYPYFFDSNSSGFLYFQAGTEKPRFYNFQNKRWFTID